jgi:hypothetical protein
MQKTLLGALNWALIGFTAAFASAAYADATVQSLKGDARSGNTMLSTNQRVYTGATLHTGPGAQMLLKFDDGQQIVMNENTSFRITDFRYRAGQPRGDRAVFDLLRGALRFITGIVGARNPNSVAVRVPQATIGIRGTDFMVVLVNPAFVNVISGSVGVTNGGGTAVFGAGGIGSVASASSLPVSIPASALPPAASGAFGNLAAAQVQAAAAAIPGGAAPGATTGTAAAAKPGAAVGAAVGLGVGAAVIGISTGETTTTHH